METTAQTLIPGWFGAVSNVFTRLENNIHTHAHGSKTVSYPTASDYFRPEIGTGSSSDGPHMPHMRAIQVSAHGMNCGWHGVDPLIKDPLQEIEKM